MFGRITLRGIKPSIITERVPKLSYTTVDASHRVERKLVIKESEGRFETTPLFSEDVKTSIADSR